MKSLQTAEQSSQKFPTKTRRTGDRAPAAQRMITLLHKDQEETLINMDKTLANTNKHLWERPGQSHPAQAFVCCHPLRLDGLLWQ